MACFRNFIVVLSIFYVNFCKSATFDNDEVISCLVDDCTETSPNVKFVCPMGTTWNATSKSCELAQYPVTVVKVYNINIQKNIEPLCCEEEDPRHSENLVGGTTNSPEIVVTSPRPYFPTSPLTPLQCCIVISPRICKQYGRKWVCFNKRIKKCNSNICVYPVIYLKTPMIVHEPPILVMPPNPPLQACSTPSCEENDIVDCSGCSQNLRETCSKYCYMYICPKNACGFMNLQEYCAIYPDDFACKKSDGCIWDWCHSKNTTNASKIC